MQALILAAGVGSRLRPLTDHLPKALVPIAGQPLLERLVRHCVTNEITDIVVAVGAHADQVETFCRQLPLAVQWTFIRNDDFATTNYTHSLVLVGLAITSDVLLVHTDIVAAGSLFTRLVKSPRSSVIIDPTTPPSTKDFTARLDSERVVDIGVMADPTGRVNCLPAYKLLLADWQAWLAALTTGDPQAYAETIFNTMTDQFYLQAVDCRPGEFVQEVDTIADLQIAETHYE